MKEGQVFPGSRKSKDSMSLSLAVGDDQEIESDEGSSVDPDPLPSNPSVISSSSVASNFDSQSDHLNASSLSGFEANDLILSQPSSESEERKFETPASQNQLKTSASPTHVHLNVTSQTTESHHKHLNVTSQTPESHHKHLDITSQTPESQISHRSADVIEVSSSEIRISERLDTLPPSVTVSATFENLPNLVTDEENAGFTAAEFKQKHHHHAEEKEAEIVASVDVSRIEKTENESTAHNVVELEQLSYSIGDISDLEGSGDVLLKKRESKRTHLDEVFELGKNAKHMEGEDDDESGGTETFNTQPTAEELSETIKLSDKIRRVSDKTSELITELKRMDSQKSVSWSGQPNVRRSEVRALEMDQQILTDTTKDLITVPLPVNSIDSSLPQDSTDGQESADGQDSMDGQDSKDGQDSMDGQDLSLQNETKTCSKADLADEDVFDTLLGTREAKTKEAVLGKTVYRDSHRKEPAEATDRKEEFSQEEKRVEQDMEINRNEDSLEAKEKTVQTFEKDLNEKDDEEGEKGGIDEEDFYQDDFVEEDQDDQTIKKDLAEDSLNEKEETEEEEDVSVTEDDSLELKEEEESTVEEALSEVDGDSLEIKDEGEETEDDDLTEDDSQGKDGIRKNMGLDSDFRIEDLQEADSLEREEDAQTAEEEELSVCDEDSLEPQKDDESSIGDEEDSLEREEDARTVEEEQSATEEDEEEMEKVDEDDAGKINLVEKDSHLLVRIKECKEPEDDDLNKADAEGQEMKEQTEERRLTKRFDLGSKEVNKRAVEKNATEKDYVEVETLRRDSIRESFEDDSRSPYEQRIGDENSDGRNFVSSQFELLSSNTRNVISEVNANKLPVTDDGEANVKDKRVSAEEDNMGSKTNEDKETEKTMEHKGTEGMSNTGMIDKGEIEQSGQGTVIIKDLQKHLNQEEERVDRKEFMESPQLTLPLLKVTEDIGVEMEMAMISEQHMQSSMTGETTVMMETVIAEEEELQMPNDEDEEIRRFEEDERRIIEEERKLFEMQEKARTAADEKTEEHEKKTGIMELYKTEFDNSKQVRTVEKQETEEIDIKHAQTADGQETGNTVSDWKETAAEEELRISVENETIDINKMRMEENGQVGIQNGEQKTNKEIERRIKNEEMKTDQQLLDVRSDTKATGYGNRELSDKDSIIQIGTENDKREISGEKQPVEEQGTRIKEDEEMVEEEQLVEEQRTQTKEDQEMVQQAETTGFKKLGEELSKQERTVTAKNMERQEPGEKEKAMHDLEKTGGAEKDKIGMTDVGKTGLTTEKEEIGTVDTDKIVQSAVKQKIGTTDVEKTGLRTENENVEPIDVEKIILVAEEQKIGQTDVEKIGLIAEKEKGQVEIHLKKKIGQTDVEKTGHIAEKQKIGTTDVEKTEITTEKEKIGTADTDKIMQTAENEKIQITDVEKIGLTTADASEKEKIGTTGVDKTEIASEKEKIETAYVEKIVLTTAGASEKEKIGTTGVEKTEITSEKEKIGTADVEKIGLTTADISEKEKIGTVDVEKIGLTTADASEKKKIGTTGLEKTEMTYEKEKIGTADTDKIMQTAENEKIQITDVEKIRLISKKEEIGTADVEKIRLITAEASEKEKMGTTGVEKIVLTTADASEKDKIGTTGVEKTEITSEREKIGTADVEKIGLTTADASEKEKIGTTGVEKTEITSEKEKIGTADVKKIGLTIADASEKEKIGTTGVDKTEITSEREKVGVADVEKIGTAYVEKIGLTTADASEKEKIGTTGVEKTEITSEKEKIRTADVEKIVLTTAGASEKEKIGTTGVDKTEITSEREKVGVADVEKIGLTTANASEKENIWTTGVEKTENDFEKTGIRTEKEEIGTADTDKIERTAEKQKIETDVAKTGLTTGHTSEKEKMETDADKTGQTNETEEIGTTDTDKIGQTAEKKKIGQTDVEKAGLIAEEQKIGTADVEKTGLATEKEKIGTIDVEKTGLTSENENIGETDVEKIGLAAEKERIGTADVEKIGLIAEKEIIGTTNIKKTGLKTEEDGKGTADADKIRQKAEYEKIDTTDVEEIGQRTGETSEKKKIGTTDVEKTGLKTEKEKIHTAGTDKIRQTAENEYIGMTDLEKIGLISEKEKIGADLEKIGLLAEKEKIGTTDVEKTGLITEEEKIGTIDVKNIGLIAEKEKIGSTDVEKTGLMAENEKIRTTDMDKPGFEILTMGNEDKSEGSTKIKSEIILEETRQIEKKKQEVNVECEINETEHEEIGTQEKAAVGIMKTKAAHKTEDSEGEIVLEEKTCKAEEEGTEANEEISENEEQGISDDEEIETPKTDATGAFVRSEKNFGDGKNSRLIEENVKLRREDAERNTDESIIEMSRDNKSEIKEIDEKDLLNVSEIGKETGMPSIAAYGVDNVGETSDEIVCDGRHDIRKKKLENSSEMASIIDHFGKEMTLEEKKAEVDMLRDDVSMTSLNKTELRTESEMGMSEDEETDIQPDHTMKVEGVEEIEENLQKRNRYDGNYDDFVDDVLEPSFAFSRISSDSALSTDDETLLGENDWTMAQFSDQNSFHVPAQSHRKRHEGYHEVDEDRDWCGNGPRLFSGESLPSLSQSTPSCFFGDTLYTQNRNPNTQSATSRHASYNQFPLQCNQISQSEISTDSILKRNQSVSNRDLELAGMLNHLPQKPFTSSVADGQIESRFGAWEQVNPTFKTQNNHPVGSSWLPHPTTSTQHFKEEVDFKENPLTSGRSSRWMNDSSQFSHHQQPQQQATLEDSYLVPDGVALGDKRRESKTLHEDFDSMSLKWSNTHRSSVDGRANGVISNSVSGGVNGRVDSGRYHGRVSNSVNEGLLMYKSRTTEQMNGLSDGSLDEEEVGDVRTRLIGSHEEKCEGSMIHPLECIHQTAATPTCSSVSCLMSRLNKPQELQRPVAMANRFLGKGTAETFAMKSSSRDDIATHGVHNYLEADDLWKIEKARILKGVRSTESNSSARNGTARNATARSVEERQPTSSVCVLVDNMKSINSRLKKEANDHLWKENIALWKELEQEHLTYKRQLELHQMNQRLNNKTIRDLQQQISFFESEISKKHNTTRHDFTRP